MRDQSKGFLKNHYPFFIRFFCFLLHKSDFPLLDVSISGLLYFSSNPHPSLVLQEDILPIITKAIENKSENFNIFVKIHKF